MTRKRKLAVAAVIVFTVVLTIPLVFLLVEYGIYLYNNPLLSVSGGELLETSVSPNGRWEVRIYSISGGGAAGVFGTRAEAKDLKQKRETRNIFLQVGGSIRPHAKWIEANTVVILGKKIDVRTDSYVSP